MGFEPTTLQCQITTVEIITASRRPIWRSDFPEFPVDSLETSFHFVCVCHSHISVNCKSGESDIGNLTILNSTQKQSYARFASLFWLSHQALAKSGCGQGLKSLCNIDHGFIARLSYS